MQPGGWWGIFGRQKCNLYGLSWIFGLWARFEKHRGSSHAGAPPFSFFRFFPMLLSRFFSFRPSPTTSVSVRSMRIFWPLQPLRILPSNSLTPILSLLPCRTRVPPPRSLARFVPYQKLNSTAYFEFCSSPISRIIAYLYPSWTDFFFYICGISWPPSKNMYLYIVFWRINTRYQKSKLSPKLYF